MSFPFEISFALLSIPLLSLILGWVFCFRDKFLKYSLALRVIELFSGFLLLLYVFLNKSFEFNFFSGTFFSTLQIYFGLRADELSVVILSMILFLSLCIFKYSIRYFDGDPNKYRFFKDYQFTIFFVVLLVLSNNLLMFFLAWHGISYGLHKLLLYYPNRPKAILAANKKWFVSRIGDCSLLIAIILTYYFFNTLNFSELISISHNSEAMTQLQNEKYSSFIGVFVAIGALAKSAQFPFHFWLPETMETPTPVSALMHAGIINAGGFLILRFSPILIHATFFHTILSIIGGFTAVFAALVMMTQTDIKKQLAYSTISQLGFMMIQCGIGAYTFALFHMIAHGFYKAYSFLSTPSILEENKAPKRNLSNFGLIFSYSVSLFFILIAFFQKELPFNSAQFIYVGILILALTQVIGSRKELIFALKKNPLYSGLFFVISISLYLFFEFEVSKKFKYIFPSDFDSGIINMISTIFIFVLFSFGIYLAKLIQDISNSNSKKIWVFFWNGGYIPAISSKLFKKE
ncbi:hypothetical protein GCL60_02380 [Silvanigrella paludirubra]|uniref:Probable inorganic carbon transporter subunit DabB n=1 Tax=Silvanigrella paludirubra TaxID=2499159 RepID=A0A6N6VXH0_9BACT|nr:proton-conducting transporter membrane subunit [Silvanigrella paludirubra]KAB8040794.1 hypothetical protein GCL60_02380 [Silvanigrella paludirubra]